MQNQKKKRQTDRQTWTATDRSREKTNKITCLADKKREKTKVPEGEKDRKKEGKREREEGAKVLKKLNRESMRERE